MQNIIKFYQSNIRHYINTIDKVHVGFNFYSNKIDRIQAKFSSHVDNFIEGLNSLSEDRLPSTLVGPSVLHSYLSKAENSLDKTGIYELLYGTHVSPYYKMPLTKAFTLNEILFLMVAIPLQKRDIEVMNIF